MKYATIRLGFVFALLLSCIMVSAPAKAWEHGGGWGHEGWRDRGWRGDGWRGDAWRDGGWGGWGLGAGIITGTLLGAELATPYPNPYYYPAYPSTVVVQQPAMVVQQPQVVVQQPPVMQMAPTQAAPVSSGTWYYCDSARGYYPYVSSCPQPWRTVPAVPPGAPNN